MPIVCPTRTTRTSGCVAALATDATDEADADEAEALPAAMEARRDAVREDRSRRRVRRFVARQSASNLWAKGRGRRTTARVGRISSRIGHNSINVKWPCRLAAGRGQMPQATILNVSTSSLRHEVSVTVGQTPLATEQVRDLSDRQRNVAGTLATRPTTPRRL